jgi:hypothetical protein
VGDDDLRLFSTFPSEKAFLQTLDECASGRETGKTVRASLVRRDVRLDPDANAYGFIVPTSHRLAFLPGRESEWMS